MKKYQISFYVHKRDKIIATTIATVKNEVDASNNAYEFLKEKYPNITRYEYMAIEVPFPQDVSQAPVEILHDTLTYGQH